MTKPIHRSTRRALYLLLATTALAAPAGGDLSAQSDRERIADYLLFYYVGFPNNEHPSYRPQRLDNQAIMAGTESGDFWIDDDVAVLHDFVRSALQEPPDAQTARFQRLLAQILDIRGERAAVYLIDDVEQALANDGRVARRRYGASVDQSGGRVWPSATSSRRSSYAGSFAIGAHYATSAPRARSAFLHELTHLQLETDERPHLFIVAGKSYVYGTDGDHYANELIPDVSRTFDEAVANSMELLYDDAEAQETFEQFQPDDFVTVEVAIPDPSETTGPSIAPEVWLDDQIQAAGGRPVRTRGGYAIYEIGSLPARFIVHNELVLALAFSEYVRRHAGLNGYIEAIRRANDRMMAARDELEGYDASRLTISSTANLIEVLCELGAEGGIDPRTASTSEPTPALLPLAFLDYFTGLAARDEADFAALFDGQVSAEWIRQYWNVGRPAVDAVVGEVMGGGRLRATVYSDLDEIANAFGAAGNQL